MLSLSIFMDNTQLLLLITVLVFLSTLFIVGWLKVMVLRWAMMDMPNQRSLHSSPIPKGGGVVFVIVLSMALLVFSLLWPEQLTLFLVVAIAVTSVSYLGWLDDRYDISPHVRLTVQFSIAGVIVYLLGPFKVIQFGDVVIGATLLLTIVSLFWLVWLINLYNFMDGIDGIATGQAVIAATTLSFWFVYSGDVGFGLICLLVSTIGLGFLVWNWSPARIFLGDVGSTALGIFFGLSALVGVNQYHIPIGAFILLLGVFLGDATFTLLRRLLKGENLAKAHRSHLYQRLVEMGYSHGQVTAGVMGICIFMAVAATMVAMNLSPLWLWYMLGGLVLLGGFLTVLVKEKARSRSQ